MIESELKPVRDFKFVAVSGSDSEFLVQWQDRPIGAVWKKRKGWVFKRQHRTRWSQEPLHNRITAARALADEPLEDAPSRYPSKRRSRRKALAASFQQVRGERFVDLIFEELVDVKNVWR